MGIPISYDAFDARWKQEEQLPPEQQFLHNKIERYDGHGIVLKTNDNGEAKVGGDSHKESEVSRMAKRATKLGK